MIHTIYGRFSIELFNQPSHLNLVCPGTMKFKGGNHFVDNHFTDKSSPTLFRSYPFLVVNCRWNDCRWNNTDLYNINSNFSSLISVSYLHTQLLRNLAVNFSKYISYVTIKRHSDELDYKNQYAYYRLMTRGRKLYSVTKLHFNCFEI